jgi:hypothetical protein
MDDEDLALLAECTNGLQHVAEAVAALQPTAGAELHAQVVAVADLKGALVALEAVDQAGMPAMDSTGGSLGCSASRTPASSATGMIALMK